MAQWDDSQQIDSGAGDWFAQNAPPTGTPVTGTDPVFASALTALYQKYYHRDPTPDEIAAHRQNPGGLPEIEVMLKASQANPANELPNATKPNDTPDPVVTPPPAAPPVTNPPVTGPPTTGFGAPPAPYASDPNAPTYDPLPPYVPQTWTGGDYVPPTADQLYASPGYQARLDQRLKGASRQFAAQGTILNGGTVKALDRSAQDYATSEYQTLNANMYDQYKTRYAQFADAAGRDLASRSVNAADANTTFANRTQTYGNNNARTLSDYITNLNATRNNELDYWNRLVDLNNTGANLAGGSR